MDSILKDGSDAIKHKILEKTYVTGECRLWDGAKQNRYGVINVKVKHNNIFIWRRYYVHKLMYLIENNKACIDAKLQLSHLCNNRLCISNQHLTEEFAAINKQRDTCFAQNSCTGHGIYPNCML